MTEKDLPPTSLRLLRAAQQQPDGVLSLADAIDEETGALAERLTDLGLLRVVTARRYRLTEAGHAALLREGRKAPHTSDHKGGWLRRLFRGRDDPET